MRLFRRKREQDKIEEHLSNVQASMESARGIAELDPRVFDLPFESELEPFIAAFKKPPAWAEYLKPICETSVERARNSFDEQALVGLVEASSKSASIALLILLRGDKLGSPVLMEEAVKRALSVLGALFAYFYLKGQGHLPSESTCTAISAIDPLGASLLTWLSRQPTDDVDEPFWTVHALMIALWAPDVEEIPADQDHLQSLIPVPLPSPVPAFAEIGTVLAIHGQVASLMAADFAPRFAWLAKASSRYSS